MNKPLSGRRILAVEDDMLIRLTLEDMLGELGCTSVSATGTIDQALGLIDLRVFDAATLDAPVNFRSIRRSATGYFQGRREGIAPPVVDGKRAVALQKRFDYVDLYPPLLITTTIHSSGKYPPRLQLRLGTTAKQPRRFFG
jgi:hypothetical protein